MHVSPKGAVIGIIGVAPSGIIGPIRTTRLAHFWRHVAELEGAAPGTFPAAHAAAHGFMNGVGAVVFAGTPSMERPEEVAAAARRLLASGPVEGIIAPGLIDEDGVRALLDALAPELADDDELFCIWLDAADGASTADILRRQETFGRPGRVMVVAPWVQTISPGRHVPERIPPTCLVPALALKMTSSLRGLHEVAAPFNVDEQRQMQASGALLLSARGWRQMLGLSWPPPRISPISSSVDASGYGVSVNPVGRPLPKGEMPAHRMAATATPASTAATTTPASKAAAFEVAAATPSASGTGSHPNAHIILADDDALARQIANAVSEASVTIAWDQPNNMRSWRTLERRVTALLRPLVDRGTIATFHVRCDEETNEGSAAPVVEVLYTKHAEAAREVRLRVHPM